MNHIPSDAHIFVALSGGVDSSVAALLLKNAGFRVTAVYMRNWEEDNEDCSFDQDLRDVKAVCEKLSIPWKVANFSHQYWDKVFQDFLDEYARGRTPNPDILCNKEIKFKAFLDYALSEGADYIATGHYARIRLEKGEYQLMKGIDPNKDQSYFLYTLNPSILKKSLFPIGDYLKPEVRKMAKESGLVTHTKKDSTGICFIGEKKFSDFLSNYLLARPGKIKTKEGKVIGEHNGLMYYTLGQRKGLKIGGQKGMSEAPWYVLKKITEENTLIVGQNHNDPWLLSQSIQVDKLHWVQSFPLDSTQCHAKIRYRQTDAACKLHIKGSDLIEVLFDEPQWAATPGQSVVFYQGDRCLGGGIIQNYQPLS